MMKSQGASNSRSDQPQAIKKRGRGQDSVAQEFPLVTVGVTCFNSARTIVRAIESATKQDWPNKEVIVVDDASTDGSSIVLEEMTQKYPQLRIIRHKENEGYPSSLNTIIKASRGEFLAIFDDDDESRPDRLAKQWQRLTDYERASGADLVLCYTNRHVVHAGQTRPDHIAKAIGREPPEPAGPIVANYLFGFLADSHHVWGMLGSGTLMARKRVFLALGDFDISFRRFAEFDLAVRAALRGGHFIAVNEPVMTQYKTAAADNSGEVRLAYALQLRRKHKNYLVSERAYLASISMAHAWFHGTAGHRCRHRLFLAVAYALLPRSILAAKLAWRIFGYRTAQVG
jgi:glycosyltransferase involved in cell wall biosynthesis